MKKEPIFRGVGTAVITPFKKGRIDYSALANIIDWQISAGVDAIIACGTTGEGATLSAYERSRLFEFSIEKVGGRVPVILGCGSNNTKTALALSREAHHLGANGALVVTPYYNKGTEEGLYRHYMTIAEGADIPIILYNVPSRTGVNLPLSVIKRLIQHPQICGIKEASDSAERLISLASFGDELPLYAGSDEHFYLALALGGVGVISVASNATPQRVKQIYTSFKEGRIKDSVLCQCRLLPFIRSLFCETNPVPIKYAMELLGLCSSEVRLPLFEAGGECREAVERELSQILKE
jgi:4-hydroxy-tetrahydrodipicolinate synthase